MPRVVTSKAEVARLMARARKRSKYSNVKTATADGVGHASKKQAKRWADLLLLQRAGQIEGLRREVSYPLGVNGRVVCKYVADHVYYAPAGDNRALVIEDVKSPATRKNRAYRIKCKLMKACYGFTIKEV